MRSRPVAPLLRLLAAVWLIGAALSGRGADVVPPPAGSRICLVLSGGGARGIAHIGVLKALEEQRIPIHCIAGTSMGAVIGGLYGAGYSAADLERIVGGLDWGPLFDDRPPRQELSQQRKEEDFDFPWSFEVGYGKDGFRLPRGAVGGVGFERLLSDLTARVSAAQDFSQLPIPFRAVATDLVRGGKVVFERGDLARALRASMSVPGAFAPIEVDGRLLGDGGLVMNLPVDVALSMGADVVVAVNIGTPLAPRESLSSLVGVTHQMINILTEQNVRNQLAHLTERDVLIAPELNSMSFLDFSTAQKGIAAGYASASSAEVRQKLATLALDDAGWRDHLVRRNSPRALEGKLAFVRVEGARHSNSDTLLAQTSTRSGDPADPGRLERDAASLMGRGDFERVDYRLEQEGEKLGAVFGVEEKTWGPHFFRLGLSASTDFAGDASFDLLLGHRLTWVNPWGGEWRNRLQFGRTRGVRSEFLQPLGQGGRFFVAPKVEVERRTLDVFQGEHRVAQWQGGFNRAGVDLGMPFGPYGEARLGYAVGRFVADQSIGSLIPSHVDFGERGLTGSVVLDQLDNAALPRTGWRLAGDFFSARQALVAYDNYTRWQLNGLAVTSEGRNTWQFGAEFAGFLDRSRIGYADFRLGGFQRLSGYRTDQIEGNYLALGKAVYRRRVAEITPFGRAAYLGASLELGNAWAERHQMRWAGLRHAASVFAAADTPLGPAYIGLGLAQGGHFALYLFLGRP